ncbi:hypothetical protein G6011_09782 [Alternaria panax]|uniref:Uncharacterized protein n=1 Tax=Alternaria panax TaxID=48097 RepID=A0AAD4I8D1_9PLEO|nr:hypothetical protein G6011_09782 [Alternaria panax]
MTQLELLARQNEAAKYNICSSSVPASLELRPCGLPWRRLAEPPVMLKEWKFDPATNDVARRPDWPATEASSRFNEMRHMALSAAVRHRIAMRISRITMDDDVECLEFWGWATNRQKNEQSNVAHLNAHPTRNITA